jgi:serine/threonine protein kinase
VEEKIVNAFDEIHVRGVLHDDVRAANVLVGSEERVWIIDFEYSHTLDGDENSDKCPCPKCNALVLTFRGLVPLPEVECTRLVCVPVRVGSLSLPTNFL